MRASGRGTQRKHTPLAAYEREEERDQDGM